MVADNHKCSFWLNFCGFQKLLFTKMSSPQQIMIMKLDLNSLFAKVNPQNYLPMKF